MKTIILILLAGTIGLMGGYYLAQPDPQPKNLLASHNEIHQSHPDSITYTQSDPTHDLNKQLRLAAAKIKDLKSLNENLANQIRHLDIPIPSAIEYNDVVSKIDKLPLPLIDEQLNKLFDDYAMEKISDTRGFAKRLLDAALTNEVNDDVDIQIAFSTSPLAGVRPLHDTDKIDRNTKIFGHINTSTPLDEVVIAKWQYMRTGEIISFKNRALNTNGREQYVWARPKSGWQEGQYRVSLYTMDNQVTPIGGGTFTVTLIRDPQPGEDGNDAVMQDFINSGQLLPLTTMQ